MPETQPTTPPDPATDAGPESELHRIVGEFSVALARQQDLADRREEIITRLHTEVQELRRGELETALDVVRHSLIRLHDGILRQAEHIDAPLAVAELDALLRALADEAAEALAGTGAERYAPGAGEPFDSARHRPVGRVAAETEAGGEEVRRRVEAKTHISLEWEIQRVGVEA